MGTSHFSPQRLLVIDIDGLRQDVFHQALAEKKVPHLSGLLGGAENNFGCHLDPVSTFPSITFCAQSTIFTGKNPSVHGIPGNQFFDRFGRRTNGVPRFYAFDVGDALAYDDAVFTFTGPLGLLGETIDPSARTLYERAAQHGLVFERHVPYAQPRSSEMEPAQPGGYRSFYQRWWPHRDERLESTTAK